jgi:hypothetical protein
LTIEGGPLTNQGAIVREKLSGMVPCIKAGEGTVEEKMSIMYCFVKHEIILDEFTVIAKM